MATTTYAWIVDGAVREVFDVPDTVEGEDGPIPITLADVRPADVAAACVRLTAAQAKKVRPGWLYDGEAFAAPPVVVPEPEPPRPISAREFRQRWTPAERAAVTLAAHRAMSADPPDPTLRVFLDDLLATLEVDLAHSELADGIDACIAAGLIAADRKAELLA